MGRRIGSLLEKNVEKIFRLAGFNTMKNVTQKGYEVDVLAEWNNTKIIIQCKQYERSRLNLQDVIHEWHSKNDIIKADKVVIVVYGQDAEEWQRDLAAQFNIALWDEKDMDEIDEYVMKNRENSLGNLLERLDLKEPIDNVSDLEMGLKQRDITNIVKVFGIVFLLIVSLAFPPLLIIDIILFIIWLVNKSKTKKIKKWNSK